MGDAPLARTSLFERHLALGARTGAFAGWEMPLQYAGPRVEHLAVRERLGVFDVSHMGQIELSGAGAAEALARALTNDIDALAPGEGQYTLMCADDGGVVDDLIAYRTGERGYLLVVNAANIAACRERLEQIVATEVALRDRSPETAMLALQGRRWGAALAPLAAVEQLAGLPYFGICDARIAGVDCHIARTGYTGEPGVEIMCPAEGAPAIWDALMGVDEAPEPAGLVARDTLRLEMGYPLYGHELSRRRTPVEAGLKWACDLKGGRFAGAQVMRRQVQEGTPERLVMLRFAEPGIPRQGQAVLDSAGGPVGEVTSGTLSPVLGCGIAMAYVPSELAGPDTRVNVDVRGKPKAAVVARRPLVDTSPKED